MMIAILHCISRSFQGIISLVSIKVSRVIIVHCCKPSAGEITTTVAQTVLLTRWLNKKTQLPSIRTLHFGAGIITSEMNHRMLRHRKPQKFTGSSLFSLRRRQELVNFCSLNQLILVIFAFANFSKRFPKPAECLQTSRNAFPSL